MRLIALFCALVPFASSAGDFRSDPAATPVWQQNADAWEKDSEKFTQADAAQPAKQNEDGVLVLDDDNFDDTLNEYPNLVIMFQDKRIDASTKTYTDILKPAASELRKRGINNAIATTFDINVATAHSVTMRVLERGGAFRVYSNGRATAFNGDATTADGVVAHVVKLVNGGCVTLSDAAGARAFTEGADAKAGRAYVVFGTDSTALSTAMQPIAMSISPLACAVSSSEEVASELRVKLAEPTAVDTSTSKAGLNAALTAVIALGPSGSRAIMGAASLKRAAVE
eukprot:g300.t1